MMKSSKLTLAVCALALPLALSSCNKNSTNDPTPASVKSDADVQVVNGRVVFKDLQTFDATLKKLNQLDQTSKTKEEFVSWEKVLNFTSLRAAAQKEENNLEERDIQGLSSPAHALMVKFGFPNSYASFLNADGEYQVGQKLFWFHDGFKYQADSEDELATIKQNPAVAKQKTEAGSRLLNASELKALNLKKPFVTNTVVASSPYTDGRYVSPTFYLNGDAKSVRRIIYDVQVFTDNNGHEYTYGGTKFNTSIRLQINYQYQSGSNGNWYPAKGQTFIYQIKTRFVGTASIDQQIGPAPYQQTFDTNESYSTGEGFYSTLLGSADVITSGSYDTGAAKWTFDLNGGIKGYPQANSNQFYAIGDMLYYPSLY